MLEHVKKYEKKFTITSPLFLACKKERKKENSISDRDKCLDKISNGSKCTLSDILDRWSSQGQDSIEWEKYKDENHKICGTTLAKWRQPESPLVWMMTTNDTFEQASI